MLQTLDNNLILRTIRDDADRERFAALSTIYNNPSEGATCACLLHHHPEATTDDYWLVEDPATGEVVSTTCLIPWTCHFAGLDLCVAQLEMVLTRPDYRGRGLVRLQMDNFQKAVKERGYDLSIIWGIPYYYRQYGYAYAVDGDVRESLPAWKIPSASAGSAIPLNLRKAQIADIPRLVAAYGEITAPLDFYTRRTPTYWRFLIEAAQHPVQIVENPQTGEILGYVTLQRGPESVTILESGLNHAEAALSLLQMLKFEGMPQILIAWPASTPLAQLARSLGSQTVPGGQWLLRFPDVAQFFTKIGSVLESRLAASAWRGITCELTINLFRWAYRLRFEGGKLAGVDSLGFVDSSMGADGGDLQIPPDAFVRLASGFRGLGDLFDAWPDILVKPAARPLVDALFPQMPGYLYTPYHFLGLE